MTEDERQVIASLPVLRRLRMLLSTLDTVEDIAAHCEFDKRNLVRINRSIYRIRRISESARFDAWGTAVKTVLQNDKMV